MQEITLNQAKQHIIKLFNADIVPFLHSSPALGKSSIIKQIAKEYNAEVIDLRLTEMDSSDLNGLPYFKDGKSTFLPFDTFPTQDTPLPKGKKSWILLLDEFNSALPSVQAAAYKLILDRQVGQHKLHDKIRIVACGNLDTDNAIVNTMSSALISRFAHFYIRPDNDEWRNWAINNGIDTRITAFIGFRPNLLYTLNPDVTEPYASPRTWELLSRITKDNEISYDDIPLLASLIGEGTANEFISYLEVYTNLPNIQDIFTKPDTVEVPEQLSTQWALIGALAHHKELDEHLENVITYMDKMPIEMRVVFLRDLYSIDKAKYFTKTRHWQTTLAGKLNV